VTDFISYNPRTSFGQNVTPEVCLVRKRGTCQSVHFLKYANSVTESAYVLMYVISCLRNGKALHDSWNI